MSNSSAKPLMMRINRRSRAMKKYRRQQTISLLADHFEGRGMPRRLALSQASAALAFKDRCIPVFRKFGYAMRTMAKQMIEPLRRDARACHLRELDLYRAEEG